MLLHLFAVVVALSTAVLIFAGGLVTSTGSGLSVPDWPNTYGWFMFTFPVEKWVGGIFYEHSHRLIASTVGFLILILSLWLWRAERRRWVRTLGLVALGSVILQGILGGITVLWYLPEPISIAHARPFSVGINCAIPSTRDPSCWPPGRMKCGAGISPSSKALKNMCTFTCM